MRLPAMPDSKSRQDDSSRAVLNSTIAGLSAVISFPMKYYPHILLWRSVKKPNQPDRYDEFRTLYRQAFHRVKYLT